LSILPELGRELIDTLFNVAGVDELFELNQLFVPIPKVVVLIFGQLGHNLKDFLLGFGWDWVCANVIIFNCLQVVG
jgi:hypothetical protein